VYLPSAFCVVKAEPEVSLFWDDFVWWCVCVCFFLQCMCNITSVWQTLTAVSPVQTIFVPMNQLQRNVTSYLCSGCFVCFLYVLCCPCNWPFGCFVSTLIRDWIEWNWFMILSQHTHTHTSPLICIYVFWHIIVFYLCKLSWIETHQSLCRNKLFLLISLL
jgi:hypothetical protein